jgi:rhamnogalacturonan acetylesterase
MNTRPNRILFIGTFALAAIFSALIALADDARPVEDASIYTNKPPVIKSNLPTLFLVGDSTVRVGTRGEKGWGEVIAPYFDSKKINVVNRAIGGRSSRTFQTEGRWDNVLAEMKPGDFVLVQFGHNDGGDIATGTRPRASLHGSGDETQDVMIESTGKKETVHTFGWYMKKYARDAKAKGATPILCSLVARKIWKDGKIVRASETYGKWTAEAAKAEGADFVDLNEIIAERYEKLGPAKVEPLFADEHTHTTPAGAQLNAECVISGLKGLKPNPLAPYFSEKAKDVAPFVPENSK